MKPLFLFTLLGALYFNQLTAQCNLVYPTQLQVTNVSGCQATLRWKPVSGASSYKVKKKLLGSAQWSPVQSAGSDTFFVFNNLLANTIYQFAVRASCPDGTSSVFKKITGTTGSGANLISMMPVGMTGNKARIIYTTTCTASTVYYQHRPLTGSWVNGQSAGSDSVFLLNLVTDSVYEYRLGINDTSAWSIPDTFTYRPLPNILLILLDDARFDSYSCNGAPSFVQTPGIDRVANEGVNFKTAVDVCSICAPSRASIATGLYPIKHGVIDNVTLDVLTTSNVAGMLQDAGYQTSFLGKNHSIFEEADNDFDFWMESLSAANTPVKQFEYNSSTISIEGNLTNILTDSAVKKINQDDNPFFVWLAFRDPHYPLIPDEPNEDLFSNQTIPLGSDTADYATAYPSFYDTLDARKIEGEELIAAYRDYYEVIQGVDSAVGRLLDTLEASGKLDNTLVIFMSDNGYLYGEHGLHCKRLVYDPSIRIPLFMRYPEWFDPGTEVNDQIALNMDIAPTILQAAGIESTYPMDGVSLQKIYAEEEERTEMYYHYFYSEEQGWQEMAAIYAIRDFNYKYVKYGCEIAIVEELFDLVNDSLEMINLATDPEYDELKQFYAAKLSGYRSALNDTAVETLLPCYTKNNLVTFKEESVPGPLAPDAFLKVFPNPNTGVFTAEVQKANNFSLTLFSLSGSILSEEKYSDISSVSFEGLLPGAYLLQYSDAHQTLIERVVVH